MYLSFFWFSFSTNFKIHHVASVHLVCCFKLLDSTRWYKYIAIYPSLRKEYGKDHLPSAQVTL